jgi:hypothetical protein
LLLIGGLAVSVNVIADQRVDPAVTDRLHRQATVQVIVAVDGRMSEVREVWRQISRALGNRYGHAENPPNNRNEFLAEVNRFGLMIVLNQELVSEVYLPFETTVPGSNDDGANRYRPVDDR